MRDIKFRAWDKKDKIMWLPITLGDLILGGWEMKNADSSWSLPHDDYIQFSHDETIWMQYTGLKDKNGTEIYEGDILTDNIVVGWCELTAGFCLNKNSWMFPHYFKEALDANNVEIIGNAYENPELLKESK